MNYSESKNEHYISESLFKTIFKALPTHVYFKDLDLRYVIASNICQQYTYNITGKNIIDKRDSDLYEDQNLVNSLYQDDMKIIETKKGIHFISQIIRGDEITYCDVFKEPLLDDRGELLGIIGVINDITEQKELEIKQRNLNKFDALTGLYNRTYYEERLQNLFDENSLPLSIIIGDTNQLKYINDNYGHMMGDDLLKFTAKILQKSVAEHDEVFRIGGDEFIIFCPKKDESECLEIIKQINRLESECVDFCFEIRTSLGYAIVRSINDNILEKINLAEKNMYLDKRKEK